MFQTRERHGYPPGRLPRTPVVRTALFIRLEANARETVRTQN